jgi:ribosomal-protein-alanine N-acetyltransferase
MRKGDGEFLVALNQHPDVQIFTGDLPFESSEAAEKFIEDYDAYRVYGMGRWLIEEKNRKTPIGFCGIKYHPKDKQFDLGYRILPEYWNQGYATECGLGCLKWATSKGISSIVTCIHPSNTKSMRVSEKLDFRYAYERYYGEIVWLVYEPKIKES